MPRPRSGFNGENKRQFMETQRIEGEGDVQVQRETTARPIDTIPMDRQIQVGSPSDQTAEGLKLFEESVRVAREKLKLAISLTEPGQLLVMAGKEGKETVYFTGGASDRILRMGFGMRWGEKEVRIVSEPDGSKTAIARATLYLSTGEEYERFEGRRTMRLGEDGFKGYVKNENDLIKSSLQNMKHVAVTDLLGMRELTPADLTRLGVDISKLPRRAEFESHENSGPDGEMVMPFGKQKGLKLTEINDRDLDWYIQATEKSVADPEKAKWKAKEQKRLDLYRAEKEKRAKASAPKLNEADQQIADQFAIRFKEECMKEETLRKLGSELTSQSESIRAALKPLYEARLAEIRAGK